MRDIEGATSVRSESISQFEGKGIRETHQMMQKSWQGGGRESFFNNLPRVTSFEEMKAFFLADHEAGIAGRTMKDISEDGPEERRFYAFGEFPETTDRNGDVEHERQIAFAPMPTIFMTMRDAADSVFRSDHLGNYTNDPYQTFVDRVSGRADGAEVYEGVDEWIQTFLSNEGINRDLEIGKQKEKLKKIAQDCRDLISQSQK